MRLNVKSPKREKEEEPISEEWQDWLPINQSARSRAHSLQRSDRPKPPLGQSEAPSSPKTRQPAPATLSPGIAAHSHSPSNELFIRHVTRDSMVDNLLSSFDLLTEGPSTYPTDGPFVSNFPRISSTRSPDKTPSARRSREVPTSGTALYPDDDNTNNGGDGKSGRQESFDPYSVRTTPIRSLHASPRASSSKDRPGPRNPEMDTKEPARSATTSRPASSKHGKKKSRSSNKSLESKDGTLASSTSAASAEKPLTEKQLRRRSRTGPAPPSSSILDRARPVPAEYHVFNNTSPPIDRSAEWKSGYFSSGRPTIFHRGSDGPSTDENFKPQISSRGKVAALTGSDMVLANARDGPATGPSSRKQSVGTLDSHNLTIKASSPTMIKHQPSVDSTKSRQGFFRRVFGTSRTNTPRPETPPFQLPPLNTHFSHASSPSKQIPAADDASKSSATSKPSAPPFNLDMPPPPAPQSGELPHVIQKKSSFFRRRKKSVTGNLSEDPMPKPNLSETPTTRARGPSASSLRQAMDPFLQDTRKISPAETFYFDSHEQQPAQDDGAHVAAANLNSGLTDFLVLQSASPHEGKASDSARLSTVTTSLPDAASTSSPRLGTKDPGLREPNKPDRTSQQSDATLRRPLGGSPLLGNEATSAPSSTSKRPAASAAQLTGRMIPDDVPDDDWVSNTPFRRPAQTDLPSKPPRLWLNSGEDDDDDKEKLATRPVVEQKASASSIPTVQLESDLESRSPISPLIPEIPGMSPTPDDLELAKKLFEEHNDHVIQAKAALLLGQRNRDGLRRAYVELFDFGGINILLALRDLCGRLALKGETQQVDRIITAFSERWCDCNPNNGFKSRDVVHTICYSILLLNTDLHIADVDQKMTKPQFVKNTLSTVSGIADGETFGRPSFSGPNGTTSGRSTPWRDNRSPSPIDARPSTDGRLNLRNSAVRPMSGVGYLGSPSPFDSRPTDPADVLVNSSFDGPIKGWEERVANVLREFYTSIRNQRLPLHSSSELHLQDPASSGGLGVNSPGMRRAGSVISKSGSEGGRRGSERAAPNSWNVRVTRSKAKLYGGSAFGSSTTSFEEGSIFSPTASSTWSRSLGRQTTTMSSDSLASAFTNADYGLVPSAGFASALSHAIIREEEGPGADDDSGFVPILDDETLELEGAPWAKEGMLHHKHHLEATDKKAKDRNWTQCFAVIEKGQLRLFSFSSKTAGRSQKNKTMKGGAVGGGNWMDNAEELASFTLRQTLANELPPPGYSSKRPHVFALMFPTGALHLFHVGTPEIAREFVSTANYWAARLSKEPLVGGVSNIEYGWSENVINTALLPQSDSNSTRPLSSARVHSPTPSTSAMSSRPSIQGSLRGASFDIPGRARMPCDKIALSEWVPPQQSLGRSDLREAEQLAALKRYVKDVEDDLRQHNELRSALTIVYTPRHSNAIKAMQNWERKSSYLLREIVKFRTYIDTLEAASASKARVYKERADRSRTLTPV